MYQVWSMFLAHVMILTKPAEGRTVVTLALK
jgi:hypothetical protein